MFYKFTIFIIIVCKVNQKILQTIIFVIISVNCITEYKFNFALIYIHVF